jgi:hypothetical protein
MALTCLTASSPSQQIQTQITASRTTNTVQMITEMNLWDETGDIGDDYLTFKILHDELIVLFSKTAGSQLTIYDVEHAFWFRSGRFIGGTATPKPPGRPTPDSSGMSRPVEQMQVNARTLPNSFVPPIVAVIPRLALNDPAQEIAQRTNTTVERALETSTNAAFTMLGYKT